jgi:hypothetical protein
MGTNTKKASVFLKWNGEMAIRARLFGGGGKVEFEKGDVKIAEFSRAHSLAAGHKGFSVIELADLTPADIKQVGAEKAEEVAAKQELEKEMTKLEKKHGSVANKAKEAKKEAVKAEEAAEVVDEDGVNLEGVAAEPEMGVVSPRDAKKKK